MNLKIHDTILKPSQGITSTTSMQAFKDSPSTQLAEIFFLSLLQTEFQISWNAIFMKIQSWSPGLD